MKMKMSLFLTLITIMGLLSGCGNSGSQSKEIALGLTAPMTGDYAEYGNAFKNAIDLAIEKTNAEGGINGKKLKLVVGDSKADPKEAANIAQKFAADSAIHSIIGDFMSTAAFSG